MIHSEQAKINSVDATTLPKRLLSGKNRSALIEIGMISIEVNGEYKKNIMKQTSAEGTKVIKAADRKVLLCRKSNRKNENKRTIRML